MVVASSSSGAEATRSACFATEARHGVREFNRVVAVVRVASRETNVEVRLALVRTTDATTVIGGVRVLDLGAQVNHSSIESRLGHE